MRHSYKPHVCWLKVGGSDLCKLTSEKAHRLLPVCIFASGNLRSLPTENCLLCVCAGKAIKTRPPSPRASTHALALRAHGEALSGASALGSLMSEKTAGRNTPASSYVLTDGILRNICWTWEEGHFCKGSGLEGDPEVPDEIADLSLLQRLAVHSFHPFPLLSPFPTFIPFPYH